MDPSGRDRPYTYSPYSVSPRHQRWLLSSFWLFALTLLVLTFAFADSMQRALASCLISATALMPAYLWSSGRAKGLPIFPLLAISFLWSFSLPLVIGHPLVNLYSSAEHLSAALKVTIFLLVGTIVWFPLTVSEARPPREYYELPEDKSNALFLWILLLACLYYVSMNAGWLSFVPYSIIPFIRTLVLGLNVIAVFALSYKLGRRTLTRGVRSLFLLFFFFLLMVTAAGLILIQAVTIFLVAIIGFIVGRRSLPWKILLVVFVLLSLLHLGKGEMRAKYWWTSKSFQGSEEQVQRGVYPWTYGSWYREWLGYGVTNLLGEREDEFGPEVSVRKDEIFSLLDRACVIHLLLKIQSVTPSEVPYMMGSTYSIIPSLLVPRILNRSRKTTHEGTTLLNIHYGLQTREAAQRTTIGWGLLNESYANFGYVGILGLAILLGLVSGVLTRWSMFTPILSARAMIAVIAMSLAIQRELTAGVVVTVAFQTLFAIVVFAFFFMQKRTLMTLSQE